MQPASLLVIRTAESAAIGPAHLIAMMFGGIAGGFPGSAVCPRPSNWKIRALFCVYGILRFSDLAVRLHF